MSSMKQKMVSRLLRMVLLACVLNLMPATAFGQKKLLQQVDSILASFQKVTTDTNYIVRPKNRLTIRLLSNFSGVELAKRHEMDAYQQYQLSGYQRSAFRESRTYLRLVS